MFQQCLDSTFLSAFLPLSMTALFAVSNDDSLWGRMWVKEHRSIFCFKGIGEWRKQLQENRNPAHCKYFISCGTFLALVHFSHDFFP